jgi:carbonic anhydrase/acetyltransferase-like protein (isoleucine patch superfamily)
MDHENVSPEVERSSFIAETAIIIGDVLIGAETGI